MYLINGSYIYYNGEHFLASVEILLLLTALLFSSNCYKVTPYYSWTYFLLKRFTIHLHEKNISLHPIGFKLGHETWFGQWNMNKTAVFHFQRISSSTKIWFWLVLFVLYHKAINISDADFSTGPRRTWSELIYSQCIWWVRNVILFF